MDKVEILGELVKGVSTGLNVSTLMQMAAGMGLKAKLTKAGLPSLSYTISGYTHHSGNAVAVDRDILVIPNALPFIMSQLIGVVEDLGYWKKTSVVRGEETAYDDEMRNSHSCVVDGNVYRELQPFASVILSLEAALCHLYVKHVNPHAQVTAGSGWELLRYREGEHFHEHVDQVKGHPDLVNRRLSVVCVAGSDDCEGGDLVFPRQGIKIQTNGAVSRCTDGEWEEVVAPNSGAVVVFPSGPVFPHQSTPVTQGTKYSLVSFFK